MPPRETKRHKSDGYKDSSFERLRCTQAQTWAHCPWLKLVTQMVDPATNSLLVLYDDAHSIYERTQKSKNFSFKSVGIQAQGRTTILKINYRNTRQILQTASLVAAEHVYPQAFSPLRGESGAPPLRGSLPPKGAMRLGAARRRIVY
jgi:superfamily I DNA/RNA helicase